MKALIVSRGMDPAYYAFLRITTKVNGQNLVVDRRLRERRCGAAQTLLDRRATDRRGQAPITWVRYGFMTIQAEVGE